MNKENELFIGHFCENFEIIANYADYSNYKIGSDNEIEILIMVNRVIKG